MATGSDPDIPTLDNKFTMDWQPRNRRQENDVEKSQRSEMLEEYYKIATFVQGYDPYFVSIKTWGVTASGAAIGVGFSKDVIANHEQAAVFAIALLMSLSFWATEGRFKLIQFSHIRRQKALEEALQGDAPMVGPAILSSYKQGMAEQKGLWIKAMLMRHVMLPHVLFVAISIILIAFEIAKQCNF
jgi:hypothetical protein